MKRLLLLLLLFSAGAEAAVTRGATTSSFNSSASTTDASFTHTVDSGTTLLIVGCVIEQAETITGTPDWKISGPESTTLIDATTTGGDNSDILVSVFGLVSPTAATDTVSITTSTADPHFCFAINYIGTETASVAAATNFLSEDVENGTSNTSVHASAGSAGNALLFSGGIKDGDAGNVSNATSFTEVFEGNTGLSDTSDLTFYVAELLDSAPEAITVTWPVTNSNASTYIEIVAASTQSVVPLITTQRRRRQ